MTPEEKAKELIDKMRSGNRSVNAARRCALIAVDEILSLNGFLYSQKDWSNNNKFWLQVKKELLK